jgi:hypothetical protein
MEEGEPQPVEEEMEDDYIFQRGYFPNDDGSSDNHSDSSDDDEDGDEDGDEDSFEPDDMRHLSSSELTALSFASLARVPARAHGSSSRSRQSQQQLQVDFAPPSLAADYAQRAHAVGGRGDGGRGGRGLLLKFSPLLIFLCVDLSSFLVFRWSILWSRRKNSSVLSSQKQEACQ